MEGLFTIPNLTASVVDVKEPWNESFDIPKFESTLEFKRWAKLPNTKYLAYTTVEGVDPTSRVNTKENPPRYLHGLCADWDAKFDDEDYSKFGELAIDSEYPPTWISRSYSGGIHAVWKFHEPILLHPKTSNAFLRRAANELELSKLAKGFDGKAFRDPIKYYLHGSDWQKTSSDCIPTSRLHLWQFETSSKVDFDSEGIEIPLDVVREEIDKKFPGSWDGPFVEGARSKRFWDAGADNPTAAVLRPTGFQCFAGDTPFKSWVDLLGPEFVNQYAEDTIGDAIESFYYDGRTYYRMEANKSVTERSKDDVSLELRVERNISRKIRNNENVSDLDRALHMIHTHKWVDASLPFVYVKDVTVNYNNKVYLNAARARQPLEPRYPSDDNFKDKFPVLSEWINHMFGAEQKVQEFNWLSYAYKNALEGTPKRGHAHFLVGPPNCGKTLYNTVVLGGLFGGHTIASDFLVGKTTFNGHLFSHGLWTIDDESPAGNFNTEAVFTSRIKEFTANEEFLVNEKFKKSGTIFWRGRLSVTLNDDPVSIRLLPNLDMSIRDKIMAFYCNGGYKFTNDFKDKIEKELPYFAAYLTCWDPPDNEKDVRFGVKEYMSPQINDLAGVDSKFTYVLELLDMYREKVPLDDDETVWEVTCSEMLMRLSDIPNIGVILKGVTPKSLGWGLRHLASQGVDGIKRSNKPSKWVIFEPALPLETTSN